LLDAQAYHAWGVAHGLSVIGFPYLPGFAWILAPAANLSLAWGFALNAVLMAALAIVAGRLAARVYSLDTELTTYMTIGWAPVTAAIVTGQNSPLGLVLSLFAIDGVARDDALRAGLSVGALCYKPTYALAFGLLLLTYKKWKAIAVLLACAAAWYVISALAAGGDWQWPASYVRMLGEMVGPDYSSNGSKAVSIPGVLILFGTSPHIAFAVGVAGLVGGLALLKTREVSAFKAASLTGAICIATSMHAWAYDAAIALPALFWVAASTEEPWKSRSIAVAYATAPLWLASHTLRFDPLAVVVIAGTAILVVGQFGGDTG
jgi:hypothetical protein